MLLPHNVEKSAFRTGEYVAYDGLGRVWHVSKLQREWRAKPAANNPARHMGTIIDGSTLTAVAHTLAQRKPAAVIEPF